MFKRILFLGLCLLVMLLITLPVTAAETDLKTPTEIYAYMDLDALSASEQTKVIEAREEIINSESWVAEGYRGYVTDSDGNIVEEVPSFYDIFPEDWDLPAYEAEEADTVTAGLTRVGLLYYAYVNIHKAGDALAYPFAYFTRTTYLSTTCSMFSISDTTYNIGYGNAYGTSIGSKTNLKPGYRYRIEGLSKYSTYSVRLSTYGTPATALCSVVGDDQ